MVRRIPGPFARSRPPPVRRSPVRRSPVRRARRCPCGRPARRRFRQLSAPMVHGPPARARGHVPVPRPFPVRPSFPVRLQFPVRPLFPFRRVSGQDRARPSRRRLRLPGSPRRPHRSMGGRDRAQPLPPTPAVLWYRPARLRPGPVHALRGSATTRSVSAPAPHRARPRRVPARPHPSHARRRVVRSVKVVRVVQARPVRVLVAHGRVNPAAPVPARRPPATCPHGRTQG